MATTTQMIDATGIHVCTEQNLDLDIPILTGIQRQGDILILPAEIPAKTPVPAIGTPVIKSENGGNTHAIIADGPVFCDVSTPSARHLQVAALFIPEGSTAYLAHPEHGFMGIAPGNYEIRRQREMAEEIRIVAD